MLIPQEILSYNSHARIRLTQYCNLKNIAHWHDEAELIYVNNGILHININNTSYTMTEGDCCLCESKDIHNIISNTPSIVTIIQFPPQAKRSLENYRISSPLTKHNSFICTAINSLKNEMSEQKDFYTNRILNIVENIIINLYRKNGYINEKSFIHKTTIFKYKELIDYINTNYKYITFEDCADFMSLTPSYFSKIFKELCGVTFSKYLNIIKISNAIELKRTSHKNITDISIESGYETVRHFNRVFKELTGFSPKNLPEDYVFNYNHLNTTDDNFNPTNTDTTIVFDYN